MGEKGKQLFLITLSSIGLKVIEEKRLRRFGHVKLIPRNRLPRKILEWEPEGTRRKGRPKEKWIVGVRRSMAKQGQKRIL
jgi:hypothetical protein